MASLNIFTTEQCNITCSFCNQTSFGYRNIVHLDFNLYKKTLDDAVKMGFDDIHFTGGEPTLHPDFFDMISYACEHIKHVAVHTNGTYAKTEDFITLLQYENLSILFSVTGFSPEVFNMYQGYGCKDSTLRDQIYRNILDLVNKKTDVNGKAKIQLRYIVTKDSEKEIDCYGEYWENKVDFIDYHRLIMFGDPGDEIYEKLYAMYKKPEKQYFRNDCRAFGNPIMLLPDGSVVACVINYVKIGNYNIANHSISEIINSEEYREMQRAHLNDIENLPNACQACRYPYLNYDIEDMLPHFKIARQIGKNFDEIKALKNQKIVLVGNDIFTRTILYAIDKNDYLDEYDIVIADNDRRGFFRDKYVLLERDEQLKGRTVITLKNRIIETYPYCVKE